MFHLNSSLTCALTSSPVSYFCQAVKFGYWYKKNKPGHWTNTSYFFIYDKSIRKYSSCEPRPQQDFSFRLMCFKSFSEGNLYLLTCMCSHKTRRWLHYLILNCIHPLHRITPCPPVPLSTKYVTGMIKLVFKLQLVRKFCTQESIALRDSMSSEMVCAELWRERMLLRYLQRCKQVEDWLIIVDKKCFFFYLSFFPFSFFMPTGVLTPDPSLSSQADLFI